MALEVVLVLGVVAGVERLVYARYGQDVAAYAALGALGVVVVVGTLIERVR